MKKGNFDSYTSELEDIIRRSRRKFPAMVVAILIPKQQRRAAAKQIVGEHICWIC
jgi:phosphopantetheine adenylyltransferase